jgi:hypothetical protein
MIPIPGKGTTKTKKENNFLEGNKTQKSSVKYLQTKFNTTMIKLVSL